MKNCRLIIALNCLNVWFVNCSPHEIQTSTIQKFNETGEANTLENLIHEYEREHQKLYEEEIKDGVYLQWPDVDLKNLSHYCKKFVFCCILTRTAANIIGVKTISSLHYREQYAHIPVKVLTLQCKVMYTKYPVIYYITRAPEPNCVYSLKSEKRGLKIKFIIDKQCDFENNPPISNSLKRKRNKIIKKKHHDTGQPIAEDKHLLEYELEHRELLKREGTEEKSSSNRILWPYAMLHRNLNTYCYQYMKKCAPARKRNGVLGSWNTDNLYYQKLNTNVIIIITIVTCIPFSGSHRRYHITRAPDTSCVYALIRKDSKANDPFIIVFKHCDFEDLNDQLIVSKEYDIREIKIIPKAENKEEIEMY